MNRNDFLKKLGFGALAVAIAPRVVANKETTEKKPMGWYSRTFPSYRDPKTGSNVYVDKADIHNGRVYGKHGKYGHPHTYDECYKYCLGDEVCDLDGNKWLITKVPYFKDERFCVQPVRLDVNFGNGVYVDKEALLNVFRPTGASCLLKFND